MEKTVLVLSPTPVYPTSAGNRRRVLTVCEAFLDQGYSIDFAYYAHEDEAYRAFDRLPPTDTSQMITRFRNFFLIEPDGEIKLKTRAKHFFLDDWYSPQIDTFMKWYFTRFSQTKVVCVNYVFLSAAFASVPPGTLKILDTHDRFSDRQLMYNMYRGEPNFFYISPADEGRGLSRADIVLAIQDEEARFFASITDNPVYLLPHRVKERGRASDFPKKINNIGFIGHGNDANVISISAFAHEYANRVKDVDAPNLKIAGEVCPAIASYRLPKVETLGYVESIEEFYNSIDLVIAPLIMGTGLKIKTVEALAFGKPVVGTKLAFEGLNPSYNAHLCETIQSSIDAVLACASDSAAISRLGEAGSQVFGKYQVRAKGLEDDLFTEINKRTGDAAGYWEAVDIGKGNGNWPPSGNSEISFKRFKRGVIWSQVNINSAAERVERYVSVQGEAGLSLLYGTLLATEKSSALPESSDKPLDYAFTPFRRRWYIGELSRSSAALSEEEQQNCITNAREFQNVYESTSDTTIVLGHLATAADEHSLLSRLEWDQVCAALLSGRPDWNTEATVISHSPFSIELMTLAPPRLLRGATAWGVLVSHQDSQTTAVRFSVEKAWSVLTQGQGSEQCAFLSAIRPGAALTLIPIRILMRINRSATSEAFVVKMRVGRHIGSISSKLP